MFEGSLVGIAGQLTSWCMGSLINWLKSKRLNPTIKGNKGATKMVPVMVLLDVTIGIEPKPPLGWFLAPIVGLDMIMIYGEGGLELDEPEEELVWGLRGGLT